MASMKPTCTGSLKTARRPSPTAFSSCPQPSHSGRHRNSTATVAAARYGPYATNDRPVASFDTGTPTTQNSGATKTAVSVACQPTAAPASIISVASPLPKASRPNAAFAIPRTAITLRNPVAAPAPLHASPCQCGWSLIHCGMNGPRTCGIACVQSTNRCVTCESPDASAASKNAAVPGSVSRSGIA